MSRTARSATAILGLGLLVGCTGASGLAPREASEAVAFCDALAMHQDRYVDTLNAAQSTDELSNLVLAASALGDLQLMWNELAEIAPPSIQADVEAVREGWETATQAAITGDGLAAVANALVHQGSVARVDAYVIENCQGGYAATVAPSYSEILLDGSWTDGDGYQFRAVLFGPPTFTPSVDTANAKPGQALITFVYELHGRIYNLTPERNAKLPSGMSATVVWDSGSAACTFLGNWANAHLGDSYCGRGWEAYAPQTDIPMGSSVEITSVIGLDGFSVAESEAQGILDSLGTPVGWVLKAAADSWTEREYPFCLSTISVC